MDGGAPFYDTYETADGKYISVGSIEPQFFALLLEEAGLDKSEVASQMDQETKRQILMLEDLAHQMREEKEQLRLEKERIKNEREEMNHEKLE